MKKLFILLSLLLSLNVAAEDSVPKKVGDSVKKGGEAAGRGIEKGGEAVGKGLKKGAEATVKGVKKAGTWVGKKLEKAAKNWKRRVSDA